MTDVLNKLQLQPVSPPIVGHLLEQLHHHQTLLGLLAPLAHLLAKSARCSKRPKPSWLAHISGT